MAWNSVASRFGHMRQSRLPSGETTHRVLVLAGFGVGWSDKARPVMFTYRISPLHRATGGCSVTCMQLAPKGYG
jgi:hypothetical protein